VVVVQDVRPPGTLSLALAASTGVLELEGDWHAETRCDHPAAAGVIRARRQGEATLQLVEDGSVLDTFPLRVRRAEGMIVFAVPDAATLLTDPDAGASLADLEDGVPDWATPVAAGETLEVRRDQYLALFAALGDANDNPLYTSETLAWELPDGLVADGSTPRLDRPLLGFEPSVGTHELHVTIGQREMSFRLRVTP
jgi:hypothetical protein